MFMLSAWVRHPEHDEMLQLHFQNFRTEIRVNWVGPALSCIQPLFGDALKLAFSSFSFVRVATHVQSWQVAGHLGNNQNQLAWTEILKMQSHEKDSQLRVIQRLERTEVQNTA